MAGSHEYRFLCHIPLACDIRIAAGGNPLDSLQTEIHKPAREHIEQPPDSILGYMAVGIPDIHDWILQTGTEFPFSDTAGYNFIVQDVCGVQRPGACA